MIFQHRLLLTAFLTALLAASVFPALLAGQYNISSSDVLGLVWGKITGRLPPGIGQVQEVIVWNIRLPRLILALTSGLALGVSGAAYQGCFCNPLAEPYILGVSSGAAAGAALAIVWPHLFPGLQLTAFIFGLGAVFITYSLARTRSRTSPVALILSGIIVGAVFGALTGLMKYAAADSQLREITFWMMGGLYYAGWNDALLAVFCVIPASLLLWRASWQLNVLSLGDEEARSLGLNPGRCRFLIVALATFAASVSVSLCGIIAWAGLMMPHAARLLYGPDHRWVLPGAAVLGAVFLLLCDTLARSLTAAEIPLGIITSLIGAPYLLWILRTKGRFILEQ
ncbi:MAG: iron ABC transporter permease [Deltaproteobacteria bacterium]|jgi:iron complex transport system permease protein|nr:iron ABC transporter permease [Deltaproteobacteria bacterium]